MSEVKMQDGTWRLRRGDFRAQLGPAAGRGQHSPVRQSLLDRLVLRIVHTLILAQEGGFLLHSAGAIRNGRAFLFPECPAPAKLRSPVSRLPT